MNIAICGTAGSGKTTIAKLYAEKENREYISAGSMFRAYAEEHGMSLEQLNSSDTGEIDKYIDNTISERSGKEQRLVVEGRFAPAFTKRSKKVFLYCDPAIAAERIMKDTRSTEKYSSVQQCIDSIIKRANIERQRGIDKYGFDMFDMHNYDLIFDTSYLTPDVLYYCVRNYKGIHISVKSLVMTDPEVCMIGCQKCAVYFDTNQQLWHAVQCSNDVPIIRSHGSEAITDCTLIER